MVLLPRSFILRFHATILCVFWYINQYLPACALAVFGAGLLARLPAGLSWSLPRLIVSANTHDKTPPHSMSAASYLLLNSTYINVGETQELAACDLGHAYSLKIGQGGEVALHVFAERARCRQARDGGGRRRG